MTVKVVLFDLDGVLIFSKEVWFHLINAAAGDFGTAPIARAAFDACWGQGIQADREKFFPARTLEEVEAFYNGHFLDHLDRMEVEPDAVRVLAALKSAGLSIAVVSNTPNFMARGILAGAGLEADEVIGGTDVPNAKPAPDMLLLALQRLGGAAAEAIMIGDTPFDRQAAEAAGVPFAGYGIGGGVTTLAGLGELLGWLGVESGGG